MVKSLLSLHLYGKLLRLRIIIVVRQQSIPLRRHTLLSPLPCRLRLRTLGVHLVLDLALALLLGLGLMDLHHTHQYVKVMMSLRSHVRARRAHACA